MVEGITMVNLRQFFPCLRHKEFPRMDAINQETATETVKLEQKQKEVHRAAIDFERVVGKFLSEKKNMGDTNAQN